MKAIHSRVSEKLPIILEFVIIIGTAILPVFFTFPYRVNIFLSWEGAYRLYLGQVPYKDFGLPMGFAYWVIPAVFFKIFGPYLLSLVKAQAFINLISGFTFRSIFKSLKVDQNIRLIAVLLFCLSYSFFNFWPWYNHSVIVFELVAISFLLKYVFSETRWKYVYLVLSAFFLLVTMFTKQDGGGLAILVCGGILIYVSILNKSVKPVGFGILALATFAALFILPFASHGFFYWFNYGQEPHNARINMMDIITAIMAGSMWEKFYLCVIAVIVFTKWKSWKDLFQDKTEFVFLLLTVGLLCQALIFQVTSYTPPDNNIFFHSFAIAYILSHVNLSFTRPLAVAGMIALILVWWSGVYWKYAERIVKRIIPASADQNDPNKISRSTYVISHDTTNISMAEWKFSSLRAFRGVYMPGPTVDGMDRLLQMPEIKGKEKPKVLNMTELTPLAVEIPYELESGQPLWYHKGVGMFQKETDEFCRKIENQEYDVVLFETIPYLNNFYPGEVRDCLIKNYQLRDRFLAPRRPTDSHIEVYVRRQSPASE
jgi:hypothetical protein